MFQYLEYHIDPMVAAVAAENNWQAYRHKAGIGTWTLAGLLFVLPKVGPLKMVAVKGPTAATEAEYMHSVVLSTAALRKVLAGFTPPGPANATAAAGAAAAVPAQAAQAQALPAHPASAPLRPQPDPAARDRPPSAPSSNTASHRTRPRAPTSDSRAASRRLGRRAR